MLANAPPSFNFTLAEVERMLGIGRDIVMRIVRRSRIPINDIGVEGKPRYRLTRSSIFAIQTEMRRELHEPVADASPVEIPARERKMKPEILWITTGEVIGHSAHFLDRPGPGNLDPIFCRAANELRSFSRLDRNHRKGQ